MTNPEETERLLKEILRILYEMHKKIPGNGEHPKFGELEPLVEEFAQPKKEPPPEIVP